MVQKLSMKLQLFGLGQVSRPFLNADTGANAGGAATEGTDPSDNQNQEGGQRSFDDILKDNNYQSEFQKRVAEAIKTEKLNWEANSQNKIEEALTEAEKVAKMTKEQKEKYEFDKQKEALEVREAEMNRRELKATGIDKLREDNLPVGLIEVMNLSDAESFNKSYETVKEIFKTELEAAINEKLRGTNMPTSSSSGATATTGFGFSFTGVRNKK
ncbi:MAG: DUF4355 domain-containing protein [uncultured Clostridium sp.]